MRALIGIDDTDNAESRGTGYHARQLGAWLAEAGKARVLGITRHQLLQSAEIAYTSHNSAACLVIEVDAGIDAVLSAQCAGFVQAISAEGSDAGLCVAGWRAVGPAIEDFGARAKAEVVRRQAALDLAASAALSLMGLTGSQDGVIGALAAVGLRHRGRDGRFVWLPGLRELKGVYSVKRLRSITGIDRVEAGGGTSLPGASRVDVGDWPRPVMRDGRVVWLVEEVADGQGYEYRTVRREVIRQY